ncbi:MAG: 7-carboxy-7-deazaguanine synthase QueE [Patescibacteria group bacterium]
MVISEIFYSVQGEGPYMGTPSIFVRTGMCNLSCGWCDTKYTWHPEFADYSELASKKVVHEIGELAKAKGCRHLIITGGEPMLQQNAIAEIRENFSDFFIEVETNGTIPLSIPVDVINHFNISPKLSNSGNRPYDVRLRVDNAIYKFVVDKPEDIAEIANYIEKNKLPRDRVWLMPQGQTKAELLKRNEWVEKSAAENGWKYTPRLHVMMWNGERGR